MGHVEPVVTVRRPTVKRKTLVILAAILMATVVASCGQGRVVAESNTTGSGAPSQTGTKSGSANKARAQAEARRLLGSVVMRAGWQPSSRRASAIQLRIDVAGHNDDQRSQLQRPRELRMDRRVG